VTVNAGTFTVQAQGATGYAWMDCTTNTLIPNETSASFTPTESVSYAAVVSNGCGSDTAACEPIEVQGLSNGLEESISIFPNPSRQTITIHSQSKSIDNIKIMDVQGKIQLEENGNGIESKIDISNFASGTY